MRFKLNPKPSIAFSDISFMTATIPALKVEAERLLAGYRIEDPATAKRLRSGLAAIAILQGRPADADKLIAKQRAAEGKPQLQRLALLLTDLALQRSGLVRTKAVLRRRSDCSARLTGSDPAVVRDEAVARYSDVQTASIPYCAGAAVFMMEDRAKVTGESTFATACTWRDGEWSPSSSPPVEPS